MADSVPVEQVAGTTAGGAGGQSLAQAIADAVQTGVSQGMQQVQKMVQSSLDQMQTDLESMKVALATQVQKGTESDVDSETIVRSSLDPADNQSRVMTQRDHVASAFQQMTVNMVSNVDAMMKEYLKYTAGVWTQSLEHRDGHFVRSLDHFHQGLSTTSSTQSPTPKVA